jgi:hypothetical protein
MTPKFSLVTAVAGAALLIAAVPAWGQGQPATYPDVVERATAAKIASESTTQLNLRAVLPSDSVESSIGARQRYVAHQPFNLRAVLPSDSVESAMAPQPFNFRDVVASDSVESALAAERYVDRRVVADNYREPPKPVTPSNAIVTSDSGGGLEWPQIGIGFGIGILLALGLMLTVRLTRVPPIAH